MPSWVWITCLSWLLPPNIFDSKFSSLAPPPFLIIHLSYLVSVLSLAPGACYTLWGTHHVSISQLCPLGPQIEILVTTLTHLYFLCKRKLTTTTLLYFSRSLTMGSSHSKPNPSAPPACLLKSRHTLRLSDVMKPRCFVFYRNTAWPQYKLDTQSLCPKDGTFDCQILTDLDKQCQRIGKWLESACMGAFS